MVYQSRDFSVKFYFKRFDEFHETDKRIYFIYILSRFSCRHAIKNLFYSRADMKISNHFLPSPLQISAGC